MSDSPINFNGLDTAVHGPVRLGVLTALYMDGPLDFTTLKKRLGVTDGVLGMHMEKLESIGYVSASRTFVGRRQKTTYAISPTGRQAFTDYLSEMRRLLDAVESGRAK
jgi:DNA-binding MarR family transcriptional regulator